MHRSELLPESPPICLPCHDKPHPNVCLVATHEGLISDKHPFRRKREALTAELASLFVIVSMFLVSTKKPEVAAIWKPGVQQFTTGHAPSVLSSLCFVMLANLWAGVSHRSSSVCSATRAPVDTVAVLHQMWRQFLAEDEQMGPADIGEGWESEEETFFFLTVSALRGSEKEHFSEITPNKNPPKKNLVSLPALHALVGAKGGSRASK